MIIDRDTGNTWKNYRHQAEMANARTVSIPMILELAHLEAANGDDDKAEKLLDLIEKLEEFDHELAPQVIADSLFTILRPEIS